MIHTFFRGQSCRRDRPKLRQDTSQISGHSYSLSPFGSFR